MLVEHFGGPAEIDDERALEEVFADRYGDGYNEYWMSMEDKYPALAVMVAGDRAALGYFPEDGHPGFQSVGRDNGLPPNEYTTFRVNTVTEKLELANTAVVSTQVALSAAKEFLRSADVLPKSVEWMEV